MEAAGLIVAMVAAMLMVYVLPVRSRRRYATVSSRDTDRFSDHLVLLQGTAGQVGVDSGLSGSSAGPLLTAEGARNVVEGIGMSEQTPRGSGDPLRSRGVGTAGEHRAVREYSALRAKRAARIANESYAAKRRLLTAGVSVVATVLVVVLAAFSVIGWPWVALPAVFLVITLVTSAMAGERTKRQTEAENKRLAELREILRGGSSKSAPTVAEESSRVEVEERTTTFEESGRVTQDVLEERVVESVKPEVAQDQGSASQEEPGASAGDGERASAKLKRAFDTKGVARSEMAESQETAVQEERSVARASGSEWDYVPVPAPTYARKAALRTRVVHPDTDIVSVRPLRDVAVPGRPVRVSVASRTTTEAELADLETASRPTFRFDLDAVLEQRRAQ